MRKIWCKNIFTLHRYRDFHVGVFNLNHPVCTLLVLLLLHIFQSRLRIYCQKHYCNELLIAHIYVLHIKHYRVTGVYTDSCLCS